MTPVMPAPAASLLLVRDGRTGLEVLMVERSRAMTFASGMLVFPGGRVDPRDHARILRRHAPGPMLSAPADAAFRVAALRELFEEAGILLGGVSGARRSLGEGGRLRVDRRYRGRLQTGRLDFARMLDQSRLTLDLGGLTPFAHWITPELAPKRFDTRFYIAKAPASQRAASDGAENVAIGWRRPGDLIAAWQEKRLRLMFPTRLNLMKLARAGTVADALRQARDTPVVTVIPEIHERGVRRLTIPMEAGFGVTDATHDDLDPIERGENLPKLGLGR